MGNSQIRFDTNAKQEILELLNKSLDDEGYIVEKDNPAQKVLSSEGEPLKLEDFAGVRRGSEIFIKSDLPSLIDVSDLVE